MKRNFLIKLLLLLCILKHANISKGQEANELLNKVKAKLNKVNDYAATAILKTDVAFIKAPPSNIKVYYKKPDRFRLINTNGISILPKGGITVNLNNLLETKNFTVLDAGYNTVGNIKAKTIKLIPDDETNKIVLSTLYIDEARALVLKTITTTRDNGTYELLLSYGKYSVYGLPDKVEFSFNAKDYKLPKGLTMDFEDEPGAAEKEKLKNKKGIIEINYTSYSINKGVSDSVFQ